MGEKYIVDEDWIKAEDKKLSDALSTANNTGLRQDIMSMGLANQEKNLVQEQLSLADELETIEHLLRGDILKSVDVEGGGKVQDWVASKDSSTIILTEHGVHLIMNTIMFYLNKNTLLSNYQEELINKKMEDFSNALSDAIFMEYEKVFNYPSFEDCKKILDERMERKTKLRMYAYEITGQKVDEKTIKKGFIEEIENQIEREMTKIKEQIIKDKLKRFEIIIREVQDAVHSTYLRAWNGQERRTLRQHTQITEVVGNRPTPLTKHNKGVLGRFRG